MSDLIDRRYELIEVIASGGMATVWRARDTRLDRQVAIKRPHPTSPHDPSRARMLREAKAAAAIAHPNLVTVLDAGEDEIGMFMVMEFVDGPTLDEAGEDLSQPEIIEIGAQVAEALAIVHGMGIVHRDVKPSNILMSDTGPQLTDFGIAISGDESRLTGPGQVMTTPSYAAPEVMAGEPATPASDMFSLAVSLYHLLMGKLPLVGNDRDPLPGSVGDPDLDEFFGLALSRDPELRPDAASFAARLRNSTPTRPIITSEGSTIPISTIAPPPGLVTVKEDKSGKSSPWWLASATVLLLILAAFALAIGDDDGGALTSESTTTSTTASATTPTTTPSTLTPTPADTTPTVASARGDLEAALAAIHPSELKPKDLRSIMEKVDDAIAASEGSDVETATKKLNGAAKDIEKKVDEDSRQEIIALLGILAAQLGITLFR